MPGAHCRHDECTSALVLLVHYVFSGFGRAIGNELCFKYSWTQLRMWALCILEGFSFTYFGITWDFKSDTAIITYPDRAAHILEFASIAVPLTSVFKKSCLYAQTFKCNWSLFQKLWNLLKRTKKKYLQQYSSRTTLHTTCFCFCSGQTDFPRLMIPFCIAFPTN